MPLEKAKLMEIEGTDSPTVVAGSEIPVQFNPATLKLSLANKLETQDTHGQQQRQFLGLSSTTLSFDLQFDTSDEGTTETPVSVRTRTAAVERFLLPKINNASKQRPPKARFIWHDLQIDGMIEDLSIDFDLFASDGTPLRAKMTVSMKEQNAKYQAGKLGPGANTATGGPPGASGTGPGSFGASFGANASLSAGVSLGAGVGLSASAGISAGVTDSTRTALSGESAAQFAARNGLDPAAWRGVTAGLDSTLSLKGGAEVDFSSSLSAGAGVGVAVGVEAGSKASLDASFGLDTRGAVPTPAGVALGGSDASAGFALASAGGVSAALETVSILKTDAAAAASKVAFGAAPPAPTASVSATPAPPEQPRTPLALTGLPSATTQAAAPSAPPPPIADTRATSFGYGVPLRPRVGGGAVEARSGSLSGAIPLRPSIRAGDVLVPSVDPTAAPWTHLPVDTSRTTADAMQRSRFPARPCGCSGPCGHGAGR